MSAQKQLEGSKHNGLAAWRQRQADERRLRLLELEHYCSYATTEVRDGQEFTLVKIPDRYHESRPEPKPESPYHRHSVELARDAWLP